MVDFYTFLKFFEIFEIHQYFPVKLLMHLILFEHCRPNTVELD